MKRYKFRTILRLTFIFVALSFNSNEAKAQVGEYRSDLAIGVNGGYALNRVSFDPTIKQLFHGGMTGGLTIRYTCERYFSMLCALQAEINYTQMGWKENIETCDNTYLRTVNYMQIPLLAHLGFGKEYRGVKGFLVLGPQLGIYLSDNAEQGGEAPWQPSNRPNGVCEQYDLEIEKKFEYGITGGLGLEVSTKIGHFILEGRYFYGLSDMFNNGKADPFGRSANGAIIAKASYLFDVIKTKKKKELTP